MTHPYPDIWDRLRTHVDADPTPGEQRLVGAVMDAQAEPQREPCPTCRRYGWLA